MNKYIFYKEELDYILDNYKKGVKLNVIAKHLNRTTVQIKKELYGYIKEQHHNGLPIYTLSKEYRLTLDNIKEIIDITKLSDITYMAKKDVDHIAELLKSKKKYCEIAKSMNVSKDTILLYHNRYIKDHNADSNISTKIKITKRKSKMELLEEENQRLKQELENIKKLIMAND